MDKRVKIGLDFHGVITDNPHYFSKFTQAAVARGYEIHIITGGPALVVRKMLDDWQVSYTTVFAILDFYELLGKVRHFSNGEFKVDKRLWNEAKARYCAEHKISFHIDDSPEYARWFSTPFCCYDSTQKDCCADGELSVDLNSDPEATLDRIVSFINKNQSE